MKLRLAKASQLSWSWALAWLSLAIKNLCLTVALETSDLNTIIHSVLGSTSVELVMQFLLDCSSLAAVI